MSEVWCESAPTDAGAAAWVVNTDRPRRGFFDRPSMTTEAAQFEPSTTWPRAEEESTVLCNGCGARIPRGETCPTCTAAKAMAKEVTRLERRDAKRATVCTERIERMVSLVAQDGSSADVVAMVESVIDQLGGIEGAAATWVAVIKKATEGNHLMAGLKAMNDLAHMMIAVAPKIERRTDYRSMSDEDLEQEYRVTVFREAMLKLAQEEPDAAPYVERYLARAERLDGDNQAATQRDE